MAGKHKRFIETMETNTDQADKLFSDIVKQFQLMRRIWDRMDSESFETMILGIHTKLDEVEGLVREKLVSPTSAETDRSGSE